MIALYSTLPTCARQSQFPRYVFLQDASQSGISYVGSHFDIVSRDESFTLEFPFDSFSRRGGGAGSVDFSRTYHLLLNIRAAYFSNIDEINFSAAIDRIRITHAIPEPTTLNNMALFLAAVCAYAWRRFVSLGRRPFLMVALFAIALLPLSGARAEIIIDGFDDDLRIDLPEQNTERVLSDGIGELEVFRAMFVSGLGTAPNGYLDINQTHPSTLTNEIPTTNHTSVNPGLEIHLHYTFTSIPFDGVDLTQSGKYNAVFLTFDHLTSAVPLRGLRVSTRHGPTSAHFSSALRPMPRSSDPFTLAFPFDEFRLDRGNPISELVFLNARELDIIFEFSLFNPGFPEQLDFRMALAEIRIGVIPEPSTIVGSTILTFFAVGLFRRRCRKESYHVAVRAATICLMFAWTLLHSDIRAQPLYFSVDSSADNNPAPEFLPEFWLFDKETEDIIYAGQFSRSANTSSGPVVTSARAMGSFSRGTTAQGTPLPPHNQNLHGNAVYAGGIGIATGICLSTGASSDTDVVGSTLGTG